MSKEIQDKEIQDMVNAFYRDNGVKVYDGILGDLVEEGTNRKYYIKRENTQPIQLESPKYYNSTDTGLINRVDPFETSQYEDEPFVYKKPKMKNNGMENITKPNSQRELITLKDAVEYSGFSKPYVYFLAKDGKIECSSRKGPLLIYKDSLEEFMKSDRPKGAKPTLPEETKQLSVPEEQQPIPEQPIPKVVSVETTSENICVPIDKSPKLNPVEIDYSIVDHNTIVTAEEAARFLGISPKTLYAYHATSSKSNKTYRLNPIQKDRSSKSEYYFAEVLALHRSGIIKGSTNSSDVIVLSKEEFKQVLEDNKNKILSDLREKSKSLIQSLK